jgi:hypothetical protein
MKHTPGPWVIHFSKAQVDAFDGEDGQPLPVCKLLWPIKKRSEAETRANANLIAAAPDLLEALWECIEVESRHSNRQATDRARKEAHAKARAVIEKAEGRD